MFAPACYVSLQMEDSISDFLSKSIFSSDELFGTIENNEKIHYVVERYDRDPRVLAYSVAAKVNRTIIQWWVRKFSEK